MREKPILGSVAAALVMAGTAQADVFVTATIDKTKTVTVTETIDIEKYIDLYTFEWIAVDAVAETDIVKNQSNTLNFIEDENALSTATISGSGAVNGITLINQAPGLSNNQGNEVSVVHATSPGNPSFLPRPDGTPKATPGEPEPSTVYYSSWPDSASVGEFVEGTSGVFTHAQSDVEQINAPSDSSAPVGGASIDSAANVYVGIDPSTNTDDITDSFNGATGVVGVNQAAGHLNNQANVVAIALGSESVYALGESDLGQVNANNYVDLDSHIRTDTITNSFNGGTGVFMVNQSSGSMNNQANVISISVGTSLLP